MIFDGPTKALTISLKRNAIIESFITALITGLFFGIASFLQINNSIVLILNVVLMIMQWALMCFLFWAFHIMFKEKKSKELSFANVASAIGTLWILMLIVSISWFAISFFISPSTMWLVMIVFIIAIIANLAFFFYSYKLMKLLVNGQGRARAIIAWLFAITINILLFVLIQQIILILFK